MGLTVMNVGLLMLIGVSAVVQDPIFLGTASNYVILAGSGVTTTPGTTIVGNVAVSPIAAGAITGFGLILDRSGSFSTSSIVTGKIYAANYALPTPTELTAAVGYMVTAYNNAAGRTSPDYIELSTGLIGGSTLGSGLYKWSSTVNIQSDVTLDGNSSEVWVFQIAGGLLLASDVKVILSGGASANNIFWQVAQATTLEARSVLNGIVLCKVGIAMKAGAVLIGRGLAQTAVTLISNSVTLPLAVQAPTPFGM